MNIVEIPKMDGSIERLLSERDIIAHLQSLTQCPFCRSSNLIGEEFYSSYIITCRDCGLRVSSHTLYNHSRVEEGMETVSDILREPIRRIVSNYEQDIKEKIVNTTLHLEFLTRQLALHYFRL